MAKFCFVSFQQPGHMDFGGRGFVKMAQALKSMGHDVKWYFSVSQYKDFSEYAYSVLEVANIEYDTEHKFYLTVDHHQKNISKSAKKLEQLIKQESFDCLVVDRLCVGAEIAASSAGIPWATVGSDGRKWSKQYNAGIKEEVIGPIEGGNNSIADSECYWARSPYLNLSFFPKNYYPDNQAQSIPSHSHFLGSGEASTEVVSTKKHVLVTFGNTMNDNVKCDLIVAFYEKLVAKQITLLVLTGSKDMTQKLKRLLPSSEYLKLADWMPYEQAYSSALLAVGHGGTSHVWTGMNMGVPLIVIPSVGDQWFGGFQVERLNLGKIINIANKKNFFQKLLRLKTPHYKLNKAEGVEILDSVINDIKISENAKLMQDKMQTGGGAKVGAKLLVRLAESKSAITDCELGKCCC